MRLLVIPGSPDKTGGRSGAAVSPPPCAQRAAAPAGSAAMRARLSRARRAGAGRGSRSRAPHAAAPARPHSARLARAAALRQPRAAGSGSGSGRGGVLRAGHGALAAVRALAHRLPGAAAQPPGDLGHGAGVRPGADPPRWGPALPAAQQPARPLHQSQGDQPPAPDVPGKGRCCPGPRGNVFVRMQRRGRFPARLPRALGAGRSAGERDARPRFPLLMAGSGAALARQLLPLQSRQEAAFY